MNQMESNQNNLNLDFKLNLGLVVFGRFSDLQKLKEYLEKHPELIIRYQILNKDKIWIQRDGMHHE